MLIDVVPLAFTLGLLSLGIKGLKESLAHHRELACHLTRHCLVYGSNQGLKLLKMLLLSFLFIASLLSGNLLLAGDGL